MKYLYKLGSQLKNPYFILPVLLMAVSAAFGAGEFEGKMQTASGKVWGYVKTIVQTICFFLGIYFLYQGIMGQNKQTAWWSLIGVVAFLLLFKMFPTIYDLIFGFNAVGN